MRRLCGFCGKRSGDDAKFVLVVTGKGREPERGVLRRQVPLWLEQSEFRSLVVGFETAHGARRRRRAVRAGAATTIGLQARYKINRLRSAFLARSATRSRT